MFVSDTAIRSARFHMVPQCSRPSLFSPDSLIEAAEVQILKHEAERAARQPPWDGYCGLVKMSDEQLTPAEGPKAATVQAGATDNSRQLSHQRSNADAALDLLHSSQAAPQLDLVDAPRGMSYAYNSAANEPRPVTAALVTVDDRLDQLELKLRSLRATEGLSVSGKHGQYGAIAEEAYRSGLEHVQQGDLSRAVEALKVAEQACTPDHPEAQAKIAALLVQCRAAQGSQRSNSSGTAPTSTGAGSESRLLNSSAPTASAGSVAVQRPPSALGTLKESASSDRLDSEGSQRAQEAYSAAYQLLQSADLDGAQEMFKAALRDCPREEVAAVTRIRRFILLIDQQRGQMQSK